MSLLDALFTDEQTETERELEAFCERRRHEREVFDAALKDWLLHSGLGPVMLEQTEAFARDAGLDGWGEQFEMYDREFDPRNPRHREIAEYIAQEYDEDTGQ